MLKKALIFAALIEAVASDATMEGKFKVVVAADEVGVGKPAPDVYLVAAERLGVDPVDCVCLEDSGNGVLAGVRAGMKVVAVPDPHARGTGGPLLLAGKFNDGLTVQPMSDSV